jgi:hypothetical protein
MEAYPVSVLAQLPPFTSIHGRSCPECARCPAFVRTPTDTPSRTWKAGRSWGAILGARPPDLPSTATD